MITPTGEVKTTRGPLRLPKQNVRIGTHSYIGEGQGVEVYDPRFPNLKMVREEPETPGEVLERTIETARQIPAEEDEAPPVGLVGAKAPKAKRKKES